MRDRVFTIPDHPTFVADLGVSERALFIKRTYTHLFGAILAFIVLEIALFQTSIPDRMVEFLSQDRFGWLYFLGGFMVVGYLASRAAFAARPPAVAYAALGAYVLVEGLIFAPLLYIASMYVPGAIETAAVITLVGFTGLTAIVLLTRKDFSFLRGIVMYGGMLALVAIFGGTIFGFHLGMWFSVAMVGLAGVMILYSTSNVMRHYPVDRHVSAALELFAAVALLFWYVLRLVMALQSD